jgi:hypothetical protein
VPFVAGTTSSSGLQVAHVAHALLGAVKDPEAARHERDDGLGGVALAQQGEEEGVVLVGPAQVHHDDGRGRGGDGGERGVGILGRTDLDLLLREEALEQIARGAVRADDEDVTHALGQVTAASASGQALGSSFWEPRLPGGGEASGLWRHRTPDGWQ